MPYPNEHAARIKPPKGYDKFRRQRMTDGVDAIYGIKADGKSEVQSLRFDKTKFSETQAKQWLKKNNFKSILFEPSSGEERKMAMSPEDLNDMQVSPQIPPRDREMYAMKDVYTTAEKAEARAKEMGGEGSHEHEHMVDDKKIVLYMPFPSHDEYLKAVEETDEETDDMGMKKDEEVKDKVTAGDVHIEKPFTQLECDCEDAKPNCDCDKTETSANEYSLEQTFNIQGIEIFSEGEWNGDTYGKEDLENMVSSFGKTGFEPPVKIGHNEEQPELKDGQPALGYIDKIYIEGKKLLADFKELPKKVYEAMKRGNYKRVSSEIYWNYAKDGKVFDRVLKAVALLGAEVPAVTNLESITGLYSKDNSKLKIYDKGVDIVDNNEQKDYSIEVAQLKEELDKVNQEKAEAIQQLKEKDDVMKSDAITSYMKELKADGKVLPVFEKELVALMSHSSDEKVFKYSENDTEVELSQFELCKKIFSSIPSLIEFSELSEAADIPEDYSNAGVEADRRAKLYMENGKADNYRDALYAILAKDEELKEKYEKEGK